MPHVVATTRHFGLSPEAAALQERAQHRDPVDATARERALAEYEPKPFRVVPPEARAVVAEMILATPFTTCKADAAILGIGLDVAAFDFASYGCLDLVRAFSEAQLTRWKKQSLAPRDLKPRSQGDYVSKARKLASLSGVGTGAPEKSNAPRGRATPPAPRGEWARVLDKARVLKPALALDMTLTADAAFGYGARPYEIARLRGDSFEFLASGDAIVTLANSRGAVRRVPVGPLVASRVRGAQRAPAQYLVWPTREGRGELVSRLMEKAAEGSRFSLTAARNRFLVDLLGEPIPFRAVCDLADLAPGGHTAQDLAGFARACTERDTIDMLRRTWQ